MLDKKFKEWVYEVFREAIEKVIREASIEDIKPVVHGWWMLDGRCSECLANPLTTHRTYCPNCGAKMDAEK